MTYKRVPKREMPELLARLADFEGSSAMRAETLKRKRNDPHHIFYVVYSYATPIGYAIKYDLNPTVYFAMTEQKFSPTTSGHQSLLKRGWVGNPTTPFKVEELQECGIHTGRHN